MEPSAATLYLRIPAQANILSLQRLIDNHAVERKSQTAIQVVSFLAQEDKDPSLSDDFIAVLSGTLLKRNFDRLLICVHGPASKQHCDILSETFNVFSHRHGRQLPASWWASSIVRRETNEIWRGVEMMNGTRVFKEWQKIKQLDLVDVLSWEDFLSQYCHLLDGDAPESRIGCLDSHVYSETSDLFNKISKETSVLLLRCGDTVAYCHFEISAGHSVVKALSDGSMLVKSLMGWHEAMNAIKPTT